MDLTTSVIIYKLISGNVEQMENFQQDSTLVRKTIATQHWLGNNSLAVIKAED